MMEGKYFFNGKDITMNMYKSHSALYGPVRHRSSDDSGRDYGHRYRVGPEPALSLYYGACPPSAQGSQPSLREPFIPDFEQSGSEQTHSERAVEIAVENIAGGSKRALLIGQYTHLFLA